MTRKHLVLLLVLFVSPALFAKNIVLFIGDGMGPAWVTATRVMKKRKMVIETLPNVATVSVHPLGHPITDSAAAATAMATGQKTYRGHVGVDTKGKALKTIADIAKDKGMSVGFVTNTTITHATPAAFYAHETDRGKEDRIAKQLLSASFDLFLGGGEYFFKDLNLSGFAVAKTKEDLSKLKRTNKPILGLFGESHLPFVLERTPKSTEPTLTEMSDFAIERLSQNPNGFFLMVEGGKIDHAGHGNAFEAAIAEVEEFDKTLQSGLKKLKASETLVLVTADHETGGLTLIADNNQKKLEPAFSTKKHSAADVSLYAWGKGSERVRGMVDNTEVYTLMAEALSRNPRSE